MRALLSTLLLVLAACGSGSATAPADSRPADAAPTDIPGVEAQSPDTSPADASPTDATPADAAPADAAPTFCAGPALPAATSVGFNYAPQGYLAKWVGSDYAAAKPAFEQDLVVLASMGVRVVRIMLLPYALGLQIKPNIGPGNWDQAELAALKQNLPQVIQRFADHGIAVILAFGPNAYYWNGDASGSKWWEVAYGSTSQGWQDFIKDLVDWNTAVVNAVEASSACASVVYYDLINEASYENPALHDLVQAKLAQVPLPAAKRGISLLRLSEAGELKTDLQASGAQLSYLEFHSYPDRKLHEQVAQVASSLASQIPGPTLLLGEFGSIYCENGEDEVKGAQTVASVLAQAQQAKLPVALHWMLWDRQPGTSCVGAERVGLGFERELPRDAYGVLAGAANPAGTFDFEQGTQGWSVGGATTSAQLLRYSGAQDAAVGLWYGRMKVTAAGAHWLCSPTVPLQSGETKAAAAGYVRSNQASLSLDLHAYDAADLELSVASLTLAPPAGWTYGSLQQSLGPKTFALPAGAAKVRLCLTAAAPAGTSEASPVYVDIDAVTVGGF